MKIWYLTSEFPPTFGGGIGMYVDIVSRMMAQEGNDVAVFVRDNHTSEERVSDHLRHIRFKAEEGEEYARLGYWAALAYQYYKVVCRQIEQEGAPDLIEVQEYNAIGYYVLQYKYLGDTRLQQTKIVVHMHTPTFELSRVNRTPEYRFPEYWIGQMEQYCIKAADGLVTQSEFLKSKLSPYADCPIQVIPLPYQFSYAENLTYQCGDYLLYAGRIEWRKGIVQLIAQMDRLWQEGCTTKLVALGGDTYFAPRACMLREMVKKKYAHRVEQGLLSFVDSVPPKELNRMMVQARAVVIPSIYENYPYTSIIAMSLGMPMLVSKQGGQAEQVLENGVNGFIFDWDDPDDCVNKIRALLALNKDELRQMGARAKERIQSVCSMEENAKMRTAFYNSVLEDAEPHTAYPFLNPQPKTPLPDSIDRGVPGMLSIVISYYNLGRTIEETVQNLLQIEYDNYEIILVNDGSTDPESIQKLAQLRAKYPALQIIDIPNGGLANVRNVGAAHARGEFLAFMDADDLVDPSYYTRCIHVLNRYENVSFVYSWLQYFEGADGVWTTFDTTLPYMLLANMLAAFAVVRKADFVAFGQNRIEMEYGMEDYDGWLGLVENGRTGVCIPEPLCLYRIRKDSMARGMNPDCRMFLYSVLQSGHGQMYEQYASEVYNLLMSNGSSAVWGSPTQIHFPTGAYDVYDILEQLRNAHAQIDSLQQQIAAQQASRWYRMQVRYAHFVNNNALGRLIRFKLAAPIHWLKNLLRR